MAKAKQKNTLALNFDDPKVQKQLEDINKEPFRSRVIVQFSVIEALLGKILSLHFM